MKPRPSPNWIEYDKSGRVIRQRFYSTDDRRDASIPIDPVGVAEVVEKLAVANPEPTAFAMPRTLFERLAEEITQPAKPPRPRRAK